MKGREMKDDKLFQPISIVYSLKRHTSNIPIPINIINFTIGWLRQDPIFVEQLPEELQMFPIYFRKSPSFNVRISILAKKNYIILEYF